MTDSKKNTLLDKDVVCTRDAPPATRWIVRAARERIRLRDKPRRHTTLELPRSSAPLLGEEYDRAAE